MVRQCYSLGGGGMKCKESPHGPSPSSVIMCVPPPPLCPGLWGQLPLFVRALPEGNHLGVLMIAAEQLAFFFPRYYLPHPSRNSPI